MPFITETKRLQALYAFVDQFAAGDEATRAAFDQIIGDVISSTNALAAYLETLVGAGIDARNLGLKVAVPTQRNDASPLQAGDFYISTHADAGRVGLMYRYDGAQFVVVSDFADVGATGVSLVSAATPAAARGLLELGSAAQQNTTAFAPASLTAEVAVALKLADSQGLAKPVTGNDWNNAHSTGPGSAFLQANAAATNGPAAVNLSAIYTAYDANNGQLLAFSHTTGLTYVRERVAGVWGAWNTVLTVAAYAALKASQAQAEGGTDNDGFMTALRTQQAIDANGGYANGYSIANYTNAQRVINTAYQNTTGRPMQVSCFGKSTVNAWANFQISPDNSTWYFMGATLPNTWTAEAGTTFTVPPGWYYRYVAASPNANIVELTG